MEGKEDIIKGLKEIADTIGEVRERGDRLEKKYDGLDAQIKKETEQKSAELLQDLQDLQEREKEYNERLDAIEAASARPQSDSKSQSDPARDAFKSAFREYSKNRKEIPAEIIDNYHDSFIKSNYPNISEREKDIMKKEMSVQSDPDGGNLVLPERISSFMVDRTFETSPVRSVARVISTAAESVSIVIDDDEATSGGWVSETASPSNTATSQIGELAIHTHEQFAMPRVTTKFLDDSSINAEDFIMNKTRDIVTRTENTAFVVGNGAGKPKGFLDYDAWATPSTASTKGVYERGKVEQIDSGVNGAFDGDTIKLLQNSLKEIYQPSAVWMIQRTSWQNIISLKDGMGNYLLNTSSLREGDDKVLLGKRVVLADDIPSVATDALAMVYGDFGSSYTIVDRLGFRVLRDPYTNKPYILYYTTKRVGGAVTNYEGLKIYKLSA